MTIQLGQIAPDFEQDTTNGSIRFHEWKNGSWCVLYSHPKDFTPVRTTELAEAARLMADCRPSGRGGGRISRRLGSLAPPVIPTTVGSAAAGGRPD